MVALSPLIAADTLEAIASLATVSVTLIVAIASGVWAVQKWADEKAATRKQEEQLAREKLAQEAESRRKEEQLAAERLEQHRITERQRREDKVADLIAALGEAKDAESRRWAASALALYPDEALPLLINALGSVPEETTAVINLALASIGPRALPELIRMNRVAQTIVAANAMTTPSAPTETEDDGDAPTPENGDAGRESASEVERLQSRSDPQASADVVGASQLLSCTRAAIAYLILQCSEDELCELDIAGVDLRSMNFAWAMLDKIRFRLANLDGVVFAHARLNDANFRGARMAGAVLLQASANGADFTGIRGPIRGIRLSAVNAEFLQARLDKSVLSAARLQGAHLEKTSLGDAHLAGADLTGAQVIKGRWGKIDLTKSTLKQAAFINTQLGKAKMSGANAANATFTQHCGLTGLDAAQLRAPEITFEDANLGGATFTGARLRGATFRRCNLGGVNFARADLQRSVFDSCTLASVSFAGADLTGARFTGVNQGDPASLDLNDAKWAEATFEGESGPWRTAFEAAATDDPA